MPANAQLRSDAVLNRGRILETAREQIAAQGPDVSMGDIARAAGVAVGTLYRHFPKKADLVVAILELHVSTIADSLERASGEIAEGASAGVVLRRFMESAVDSHAEGRILKQAARSLGVYSTSSEAFTRMNDAVRAILDQGAQAGELSSAIEPSDIYLLMSTLPDDQPTAVRKRWVELILPGLLR